MHGPSFPGWCETPSLSHTVSGLFSPIVLSILFCLILNSNVARIRLSPVDSFSLWSSSTLRQARALYYISQEQICPTKYH